MTRRKRREAEDRRGDSPAVERRPGGQQPGVCLIPRPGFATASTGILLLVGAVVVAYFPAMRAGFVRFDDTDYISENRLLRTAEGLRQIWTSPQAYPLSVQCYPMTFTTHWVEFQLWGANPTGYHVVNVGLHALNAVLFWMVLRRLGLPGAVLAALLFAVHPVQVQSVAWLAERKNVLSGLFYFLTVLAWLRFARTGSWVMYAAAAAAFMAGLLSKTVVCTLPVALLIWMWWRRPASWKRQVLLLTPLFCIAAAMIALTVWRENTLLEGKTVASGFTPIERLLIVGRGLWFYAGKVLLPINLVPIYPHWPVDTHAIMAYAFPLGAAGVIAGAWLLRRKMGRAPLAAVLFFVVSLAPTSGLVDFGYLAKSFVGDHYLYIPSVAMFAGLAALGARMTGRAEGQAEQSAGRCPSLGAGEARPTGKAGSTGPFLAGVSGWSGLAAAIVLGLAVLTWRQCEVYRDAETFWSRVVTYNPSPTALSSLGDAYLLKKDLARAEATLRQALAGRDSARTRFRLGCVLIERQQFDAAAEQFERGLSLNRAQDRIRGLNAQFLYNIGYCRYFTGEYEDAVDAFREACEADPSLPGARGWLNTAERAVRNRSGTTRPAGESFVPSSGPSE